jgi:hypothetical protein
MEDGVISMVDTLNRNKVLPPERPPFRRPAQMLCYAVLRVSLESAKVGLMLLGLPLAFALLLAGADTQALFGEIQNLAAHYLKASELARNQFNEALCFGFWGLLILALLVRLPALWRDIGQNSATQGNPDNG